MRFLFRLLVTAAYFFPFTFFVVTCDDGGMMFSYNQREADYNRLKEKKYYELKKKAEFNSDSSQVVKDSSQSRIAGDHVISASDNPNLLNKLYDKALEMMLFPVKESLSGFGSIFQFKNEVGKYFLGLAFGLSIIRLLPRTLFKRWRLAFYLSMVTSLALIAFFVIAFASDVTVLWGFWVTLILTISLTVG